MNKSFGKIIKLHRSKQKIKQDYLARVIGITAGTYSRFENNLVKLEDDQIDKLFDALGMERCKEDIDEEFEVKVYTFLKNVIMDVEYNESYNEIEEYYNDVISTPSYFKYILAKMIYEIRTNKSFYIKEYLFLEDYLEYLESYQIQHYYDMIGHYYRLKEQHNTSVCYYLKSLEHKGKKMTYGMVCYHLGIAYRNLGNLSEALRYMEVSKSIFADTLNVKRLIMATFAIAYINENMNNIEYALEKYFDCLSAFKSMNMKTEVLNTYRNILWTYMKSEQYEHVLKLKDEVLNMSDENPLIYFIISYTYYKTNNNDQALIYIKKAKSLLHLCHCGFEMQIIKSFYILLNGNDISKKEKALHKVYESAILCEDQQIIKFSLHLLCDFYKGINDIEKLNRYLLEMVK